MKIFVMAMLALLSTQSHAAGLDSRYAKSVNLERQYTQLYALQADLVDTGLSLPNCPPNAMCEPAGTVTLSFTLRGCVDELGPVSVRLERAGRKYNLYVNAMAFADEASQRTRCVAPNVQSITLPLGIMGGISKEQVARVISQESFFLKQ